MTPKGQEKVTDWLESWDALAPYFEDLDEASRHASLRHSVAYDILRAMSDKASNRYHPSDEGRAQDALLDEILEDITKARAAGVHFSDIEI
jgi:DNA-binding PadR family transcriptional regulator